MNKNTLKISNNRSGVNVYMPKVLVDLLPRTTYTLRAAPNNGPLGGFNFQLIKDSGSHRIHDTNRGHMPFPYRLLVSEFAGNVKRAAIDHFGAYETIWEIVTNDPHVVAQFSIPRTELLPSPMRRKPRKNVGEGGRQLQLGLGGTAEESPHSKLGRLFRELNALLATGDVDDVQISVIDSTPNAINFQLNEKPSSYTIKGKIIREEILG